MGGMESLKKGREITENINFEKENLVYWKGKKIKNDEMSARKIAAIIKEKFNL